MMMMLLLLLLPERRKKDLDHMSRELDQQDLPRFSPSLSFSLPLFPLHYCVTGAHLLAWCLAIPERIFDAP